MSSASSPSRTVSFRPGSAWRRQATPSVWRERFHLCDRVTTMRQASCGVSVASSARQSSGRPPKSASSLLEPNRRASPDAYLSVLLKQMFSLGLSLFMLWALALERRASLLSVLVCGNIVPQRLLSLCRSCTPPYLMVSLRADLHAGHTSAASAFLRKCAAGPYRPHTDVVN